MKIRGDFVTNSSSTSFILITDEELEKDIFLDKIGVNIESEMSFIFEQLYDAINRNKITLDEYIKRNLKKDENIYDYFRVNYSQELADRIVSSAQNGKKIWVGKLSSDYDEYETFFCTDSFIVEDEEIYINGANCVW